MQVYPVRVWNTSPQAKMKEVRVKPFTSVVKAREFIKKVMERENIEAELLDPEDYTLNKAGVLDAFNRGQNLMIESDFVQSR